MTSSWGGSWGNAWGDSWGTLVEFPQYIAPRWPAYISNEQTQRATGQRRDDVLDLVLRRNRRRGW